MGWENAYQPDVGQGLGLWELLARLNRGSDVADRAIGQAAPADIPPMEAYGVKGIAGNIPQPQGPTNPLVTALMGYGGETAGHVGMPAPQGPNNQALLNTLLTSGGNSQPSPRAMKRETAKAVQASEASVASPSRGPVTIPQKITRPAPLDLASMGLTVPPGSDYRPVAPVASQGTPGAYTIPPQQPQWPQKWYGMDEWTQPQPGAK